jgi:hypothetical protein
MSIGPSTVEGPAGPVGKPEKKIKKHIYTQEKPKKIAMYRVG